MPLPAEPLEVRVTFSGNVDSEIALVLMLDVPGRLGGRREVVLRDWGEQVCRSFHVLYAFAAGQFAAIGWQGKGTDDYAAK